MLIQTASQRIRTPLVAAVGCMAAAVFLIFPAVAGAANSQGFQVSPPENAVNLNPGTSVVQTVKITNLTDTQMTLTVTKEDFAAQGDLGQIQLTEDAGPLYSLAPWFTLSAPTLVVPPLGTSPITYTISAPANAEPGGRYGAIVFSTIPPPLPNGESGAATKSELASLILLRINGNANQQLQITSFKSNKPFYEYGPVSFLAILKDIGNVHEKPTAQIVVKNMLGLKTANVSVKPEYVLPGATRQLSGQLNRHFMFGRYTATITVNNQGVQVLSASTSFWVIPYKLVIAILIIFIILIIFFARTRKRFRRAFRILAGRE